MDLTLKKNTGVNVYFCYKVTRYDAIDNFEVKYFLYQSGLNCVSIFNQLTIVELLIDLNSYQMYRNKH